MSRTVCKVASPWGTWERKWSVKIPVWRGSLYLINFHNCQNAFYSPVSSIHQNNSWGRRPTNKAFHSCTVLWQHGTGGSHPHSGIPTPVDRTLGADFKPQRWGREQMAGPPLKLQVNAKWDPALHKVTSFWVFVVKEQRFMEQDPSWPLTQEVNRCFCTLTAPYKGCSGETEDLICPGGGQGVFPSHSCSCRLSSLRS